MHSGGGINGVCSTQPALSIINMKVSYETINVDDNGGEKDLLRLLIEAILVGVARGRFKCFQHGSYDVSHAYCVAKEIKIDGESAAMLLCTSTPIFMLFTIPYYETSLICLQMRKTKLQKLALPGKIGCYLIHTDDEIVCSRKPRNRSTSDEVQHASQLCICEFKT
uniref:Uncharacterized protein n=1 Tax=Vespula pensylvanica TaxID=30213 RepID=A0A834KHX2_VESPE|nr:hypothetical protein H0235_014694 [Vespula pensylvanica]